MPIVRIFDFPEKVHDSRIGLSVTPTSTSVGSELEPHFDGCVNFMIRGMRSHIILSQRFCKIQSENSNYEGTILLFKKEVISATNIVLVKSNRNKGTYFTVVSASALTMIYHIHLKNFCSRLMAPKLD